MRVCARARAVRVNLCICVYLYLCLCVCVCLSLYIFVQEHPLGGHAGSSWGYQQPMEQNKKYALGT